MMDFFAGRVRTFEELRREFERRMKDGYDRTRWIIQCNGPDLLSQMRRRECTDPDKYIKWMILRAGELRGTGQNENGRIYALEKSFSPFRPGCVYFDVTGHAVETLPQKVRMRDSLLSLPRMPLREYFSNWDEIAATYGDTCCRLHEISLECGGYESRDKVLEGDYGLIQRPDEIAFRRFLEL